MGCRLVALLDSAQQHATASTFASGVSTAASQPTALLQRRCYWLLSGDDGTVLVHYLANKKLGRAHTGPLGQAEPSEPHMWDTAKMDSAPEGIEAFQYPTRCQLGYQAQLQDTCMNFEQVGNAVSETRLDMPHAPAHTLTFACSVRDCIIDHLFVVSKPDQRCESLTRQESLLLYSSAPLASFMQKES